MAPQMPEGVVRAVESGVRDRSDAALAEAGYHALRRRNPRDLG